MSSRDDGGCVLWLGDGRRTNWGGFEAVMAREIIRDGRLHTIRVPLARFNPAGEIRSVLIRVPSGPERAAVLEVQTLDFLPQASQPLSRPSASPPLRRLSPPAYRREHIDRVRLPRVV